MPARSAIAARPRPCYLIRMPRAVRSLARASLARAAVVGVAALVLLSASGCPTPGLQTEPSLEPDAVHTLELYRDALVTGRPDDAFELIHPAAREGLDARGFEALYERHKDALVAQAERLVAVAKKHKPVERAEVQTDKGTVALERTSEGWRLTEPVGGGAP